MESYGQGIGPAYMQDFKLPYQTLYTLLLIISYIFLHLVYSNTYFSFRVLLDPVFIKQNTNHLCLLWNPTVLKYIFCLYLSALIASISYIFYLC